MGNTIMDKLISKFCDTNELGHYSKEDFSIMLYDIENDEKTISRIKKDISDITSKCKVIVLSPNKQYTNINILDIDL